MGLAGLADYFPTCSGDLCLPLGLFASAFASVSLPQVNMDAEPHNSFSDPFLAHLVLVLSIYELGPFPAPVPRYDGPSTWQTDNILRALKTMARRMYTAEETLASIKASENWENGPDTKKRRSVGDTPPTSNPSANSSQADLSPSSEPPSPPPMVLPPRATPAPPSARHPAPPSPMLLPPLLCSLRTTSHPFRLTLSRMSTCPRAVPTKGRLSRLVTSRSCCLSHDDLARWSSLGC
jgi:hypothetical protein